MIVTVGPHTVADGQMEAAHRVSLITGESQSKEPGFLGRLVMQERANPNEVWSIAMWANEAARAGWIKNRQLPWNKGDLDRVFAGWAPVQQSGFFGVTAHQGNYFNVDLPLGTIVEPDDRASPFSVIAAHTIDPAPEAMRIATEMIYEVGLSAEKAPGFVGRLVIQSNLASNEIWSISSWASREDNEHWLKTKKHWWTKEEVAKVFPKGATHDESKRMYVILRQ